MTNACVTMWIQEEGGGGGGGLGAFSQENFSQFKVLPTLKSDYVVVTKNLLFWLGE